MSYNPENKQKLSTFDNLHVKHSEEFPKYILVQLRDCNELSEPVRGEAEDEFDMFVFTNYNGTRGISSVYMPFYI